MKHHLPYLAHVVKVLIVWLALALFAASPQALQMIEKLQVRFDFWPPAAYPAYWLLLNFAIMLLILPFHLFDDHWSRHATQEEEGADALTYWLQVFFVELSIATAIGCLISAVMWLTPGYGWVVIGVGGVLYFFVISRLQDYSRANHTQQESRPEPNRRDELQAWLEPFGISLSEVSSIPDEVMADMMEHDVLLLPDQQAIRLRLPKSWCDHWSADELVAVVLHKRWMTQPYVRVMDALILGANLLIGFGGFTLIYHHFLEVMTAKPMHHLIHVPYLILGLMPVMSLAHVIQNMFSRHWILKADDAAVTQMGSPEGMIGALEYAKNENPPDRITPSWAEVIFYPAPTLQQRIDRLKRNS